MAPLVQAASRSKTNSNPSLDTSVTYLLRPWEEVAIVRVACREGACRGDVERTRLFLRRREIYNLWVLYYAVTRFGTKYPTTTHNPQDIMRPFGISRNYMQLKVCARGFTSCKPRPRQSADDYNRPVQTCPQPLAASGDVEPGQSSLNAGFSDSTQIKGSLYGKRAIITGASRGIGAAIARRFATEGAKCVLVGRNVEALTGVREGLIGPYKADHVVKPGDVGSLEFWKDVARSEVSVS
jgi:hypothetical protein